MDFRQAIILMAVCFMLCEQSPIFTSDLAKTAAYENCIRKAHEEFDNCIGVLSAATMTTAGAECANTLHEEKTKCNQCKSSINGCFD